MHRIVDSMVENYRPVTEALEERDRDARGAGALRAARNWWRRCMKVKRELAQMRRVLIPQRDAIGRLARREFPMISDEMAFRFRDVYDHVVRLADEVILFQDRDDRRPRSESGERLESPESDHEGPDGDVDDLPAADRADRHVGDEHRSAAFSGRRRRAVLVDQRHHGRRQSLAMLVLLPPQQMDC